MIWILPLLRKGVFQPLTKEYLCTPESKFSAENAGDKLIEAISAMKARECPKSRLPGGRLIAVMLRTFPKVYAGPIVPRVIMLICTLAQPMAISSLITAVSKRSLSGQTEAQRQPEEAWALVGGIALIYLGNAFASVVFSYHTNNCDLLARSALISALFRKMATTYPALDTWRNPSKQEEDTPQSKEAPSDSSTKDGPRTKDDAFSRFVQRFKKQRQSPASGSEESSKDADDAHDVDYLTRMTVDVNLITETYFIFICHEIWAAVPLLVIGTQMLVHRLGHAGFVCVAILLTFAATTYTYASKLRIRRKNWLDRTSSRVEFMVSPLAPGQTFEKKVRHI